MMKCSEHCFDRTALPHLTGASIFRSFHPDDPGSRQLMESYGERS